MKMKNIMLFLLLSNLIIAPLLGQTKEEKKEQKAIKEAEEFENMKALIDKGIYEFQADWTTSSQGARVNLMTRANLLKINKDSIDVHLSYFGVLQSGSSAISNQQGVVFNGPMENYSIEINEKKRKITVKFDTKGRHDQFQYFLTINRNGNSTLSVTSPVRSTSKYDGTTKESKPNE
jgi:hypothetical protein